MERTALLVSVASAASPTAGAFPQKPLPREPGQSTARRGRHNATNGINGAVSARPLHQTCRSARPVPERHAAIGRAAPGKTGTFEGSSHQTRSPTKSAPSRSAPRTPRTSPAATRKDQGRRHESAAKQSLARRSGGAKTLAASPNLSTMNRETKRSCGGHYRRENLATDHWCCGVEVRTYTRGRRGVQRLIDGRLPDVDERSISSASGPRSLHKRMPAVRRSWPPGASRGGATKSSACAVGSSGRSARFSRATVL